MVILENIDIDIVIDKAILQNIDIDKISNRFKFGISNRATRGAGSGLGTSKGIKIARAQHVTGPAWAEGKWWQCRTCGTELRDGLRGEKSEVPCPP